MIPRTIKFHIWMAPWGLAYALNLSIITGTFVSHCAFRQVLKGKTRSTGQWNKRWNKVQGFVAVVVYYISYEKYHSIQTFLFIHSLFAWLWSEKKTHYLCVGQANYFINFLLPGFCCCWNFELSKLMLILFFVT